VRATRRRRRRAGARVGVRRPLVLLDAAPAHRADEPVDAPRHRPRAVCVLNAEEKLAAVPLRKGLVEERRAEAAEVEEARRRGRLAHADGKRARARGGRRGAARQSRCEGAAHGGCKACAKNSSSRRARRARKLRFSRDWVALSAQHLSSRVSLHLRMSADVEGLSALAAAPSKDALAAFLSACFRSRHDVSAVRRHEAAAARGVCVALIGGQCRTQRNQCVSVAPAMAEGALARSSCGDPRAESSRRERSSRRCNLRRRPD
jgi:hypothetical protein